MNPNSPKVGLTGAASYDRKNEKFIFEAMNIPPCTSKDFSDDEHSSSNARQAKIHQIADLLLNKSQLSKRNWNS
jgi:hypothetical protein